MQQPKEIINRVANSGLITIDPAELFPSEIEVIDLKDFLFQGLLLREKDFRDALQNIEWVKYAGKNVSIYCSTDAIVPSWAYMLLVSYLEPHAKAIVYGNAAAAEATLLMNAIAGMDIEQYRNQRIVIKGCGDKNVPNEAFVEITRRLRPIVKSIMYGEPCSTVPIFKQAKAEAQ